jgi:hypothetical protein
MPRKSRTISSRPTATFAGAAAQQQRVVVEFNPDYTNVKRDLKRIGILAGSFFALLIVLSFVLPLTPFGR